MSELMSMLKHQAKQHEKSGDRALSLLFISAVSKLDILTQDLDSMIIYAARYSHDRQTGSALQVVNCAIKNWPELSEETRIKLANEASNEATFNLEDWNRLIALFNGNCE